jgi:hypothetical protein
MAEDTQSTAANENMPEVFCALCLTRRAVLVEGAGPHAFCIKCTDASNKRHANATLPTDPALLYGLSQLFSLS